MDDARALMLKMYMDTHICMYVSTYIMTCRWSDMFVPQAVCVSVCVGLLKNQKLYLSSFHLLVCKKGKDDAHKSVT